jgi:beta-glucosidase/6-phospho-beta-glucosidase/beta-galactosidase
VFRSFFLGGFECATGWNARGEWIDQIAATQHDIFADLDYALLRSVGIRSAREGVRWPLVDRGGRYDFAPLRPFLEAARRHTIEPIWDLFHFGYPAGSDPFSERFPERFAEYCFAVARHVARESEGPWWFTPVNEPSYFAWAAGDAALFAPHATGRGYELKLQLARAALRGIDALRSACPEARIVTVDSLCRVVAPDGRDDLADEVRVWNEQIVFESLDLLSGRLAPELGGSREALGVVGVNYYWTNQWELGSPQTPLCDTDHRCAPLRELVRGVWDRYDGEIFISETGHVGERRASWMSRVAEEVELLFADGVPLGGVCLYPILGMPEWHDRARWTPMGLWDLVRRGEVLAREVHEPMRRALQEAQRLEARARRDGPPLHAERRRAGARTQAYW